MQVSGPSFEECFAELFRAAYRSALRITGDSAAAEDAAAEALTRAALRWRRVADHALPWVVRVAANLAIDHARREAVAHRRRADLVPVAASAADAPSSGAAAEPDLHAALALLPARQREVVVLRYFGELSEREIAAELGLAPGTVKSHASRGLAALREHLGVPAPTAGPIPPAAAPPAPDPPDRTARPTEELR